MSAKQDARSLQRYSGERYTTCLRWVRTLLAEGLIQAEYEAGGSDRDTNIRVAFHKRFPDVVIELDRGG